MDKFDSTTGLYGTHGYILTVSKVRSRDDACEMKLKTTIPCELMADSKYVTCYAVLSIMLRCHMTHKKAFRYGLGLRLTK